MERPTIKDFCDARGMSITWLAQQIELSPSHVQHIEAGRRKPPFWYYERVARILQIPVEAIEPVAEVPA